MKRDSTAADQTQVSEKKESVPLSPTESDYISRLLEQYGCGPVKFTGSDGLYERHLVFDNVADPASVGPRERFEALARSVRDVLSQRWVPPRAHTSGRIPNAFITCRWSSSSAVLWRTT